MRTDRQDGFLSEWGPECFHIPKDDEALLWLTDSLKLPFIEAHGAAKKRYILKNGAFVKLGLGAILGGGLLSLKARLRLLLEPLNGPKNANDQSLADFARRRFGPETVDNLLGPMCAGVYAGDPAELSLERAFPAIAEFDRRGGILGALWRALTGALARLVGRGAKASRRAMLSFEHGTGQLMERLAEELGPRLMTGCEVEAVERVGELFVTRLRDGRRLQSRSLVMSAPAFVAAELLKTLSAELSEQLAGIPYADIAVVAQGFKDTQIARPLDGFGALRGLDERGPEQRLSGLGFLQSSSVFDGRAPAGHTLLRTMIGGRRQPELVALPEDQLLALVREDLQALFGVEGEPCFQRVYRHSRGIPQYLVGHGSRLERLRALCADIPGLYLAGNAYYGPGLADTLRLSVGIADQIANSCTASSPSSSY